MHAGKEKTTGKNKTSDKKVPTGKKTSDKKRGSVIKLSDNPRPGAGKNSGIDPERIVFSLDIGTRTVVGVAGIQEENFFRVIATESIEHRSRAMLDGQIHDVEQVTAITAAVKEKLEARLGISLKRVAIAAAGRVLKTCQVRVDKSLEQGREVDADLVNSLEIEGIQRAQMVLDEELSAEDKTQFYCVGYSIINYYLNGYVISKLTGHKGKTIGADVLATFLPMIVVDDLYTVMNKVGLEVSSLTLEPIAAINVTIPPDLRLLNLALVDIGAGTSDIAITKDGSVIAYAMVPVAGDEITETISRHFLVDFNTGEKIKISLTSNKGSISFTDILKNKYTITTEEVYKVIEDTVQMLACTISQKILEYNHKAPNAVFLVGGGSRIPGLTDLIEKQVGLSANRVVVRGRDVIRDIRFDDKRLYGPESITPYGIAVTAQMYYGKDFMTVTVNDRKIKLFNSKKLTVADALILFGYDAGQLIGRTGKGIRFSVNGENRTVRGEYGKAAEIYVNGKQSSLDTPIFYGDNITVVPAQDGKDAIVKAYELVSGYSTGIVRLNGNPVDISTVIYINGTQVSRDSGISDGDKVEIFRIETLKELLDAGGLGTDSCEVLINDMQISDLDCILKDGDMVTARHKTGDRPAVQTAATLQAGTLKDASYEAFSGISAGAFSSASSEVTEGISTGAAYKAPEVTPESSTVPNTADLPLSSFQVSVNGRSITLDGKRSQYIFVDIFNYIEFDLTKPQGNIVLRLNGRQAGFTDTIKPGDSIEISWN